MPAPHEILKLVERFEHNRESYVSTDYKEAQIRIEFIDPFFKALGWDMNNEQGYAEAYKDVIHEDSIKIGFSTEAPDYCFRIGGARKFFLEAKKPSVNIKEAVSPAYQLRRYAWSSKLPLSILTDFDEFAIYDCRIKPDKKDSAAIGRIMYLTYQDYHIKWDEIASIFSRESILKGSFDKFAEGVKGKRGTASVDDSFLFEIENWRELLAKNIALRNSELTTRELNFAVQKTIDRIIFLRICEDRGIEYYGKLISLVNGEHVYTRLLEYFRIADSKYNSGIFHFQSEKNITEEPDHLTQRINIDDKLLKEIIHGLYYPESPFEFSVLPADILGQVYERFLGKVIRLTAGHQAKVEEKPEVRKAGGVYYTPTYIVDYIVENTVCKLLEGRKVDSKVPLKVADIACGSGSFLIVAFQKLLDWYLKKYFESDPEKWAKGKKPRIRKGRNGEWRLTVSERKRILLDHIYGVDIDSQAVEVTKLSLLLKVLEGETEEIFQGLLFHERALPDLGSNIKCGNSLIGSDYYANRQGDLFDENKILQVNAFDWDKEFSEIVRNGGFDAIIGNPPWGASFTEEERCYLKDKFSDIIVRMIDSYMYFLYFPVSMMKPNAYFGMIIPSTFLTQCDMSKLRNIFLKYHIKVVINLGDKVFGSKVLNTSSIFIFKNFNNLKNEEIIVGDLRDCIPQEKELRIGYVEKQNRDEWLNLVKADPNTVYYSLNLKAVKVFHKLTIKHNKLSDIVDGTVQRGISPDYAEAFVINNELAISKKLETDILKPVVLGKNIRRYGKAVSDNSIIYLTKYDDIDKYPNIKRHLEAYKDKITCTEVKEGKHPWFSLHRARDPEIFRPTKFIGLTTTKEICLSIDDLGYYVTDALYVFHVKDIFHANNKFILGVLHSKIFNFLYHTLSQGEQRIIPQIKATILNDIPFPKSFDKEHHDAIVYLVDQMFDMNKNINETNVPQVKIAIQRQIEATDKEIDRLVYELYGLTNDEIKIVEGEK